MGNDPIIRKYTFKDTDGIVPLSSARLLCDVDLRVPSNVNLHLDGDITGVLVAGAQTYPLRGVDLSRFGISTASVVDIDVFVIGNSRDLDDEWMSTEGAAMGFSGSGGMGGGLTPD